MHCLSLSVTNLLRVAISLAILTISVLTCCELLVVIFFLGSSRLERLILFSSQRVQMGCKVSGVFLSSSCADDNLLLLSVLVSRSACVC